MNEHGPRISRSALARMTGATALGLAIAPEAASAARSTRAHAHHLHRSSVLVDGREVAIVREIDCAAALPGVQIFEKASVRAPSGDLVFLFRLNNPPPPRRILDAGTSIV